MVFLTCTMIVVAIVIGKLLKSVRKKIERIDQEAKEQLKKYGKID